MIIASITFILGIACSVIFYEFIKTKDKNIKKYHHTLKKHTDIKNWLKSELKNANNKKLHKRLDPKKIKLLEIIISRLDK